MKNLLNSENAFPGTILVVAAPGAHRDGRKLTNQALYVVVVATALWLRASPLVND
jgi:hypothetical protein